MRNVFTVDLEEWFHVCGVPALAHPHWDPLPSRVEQTTRIVLDLLDRYQIRATFFVVGWVADRPKFVLADGTEASFRWTAVFHQDGGEWKMIQGHASLGVPNADALGVDI